jgi:hypothetical protein
MGVYHAGLVRRTYVLSKIIDQGGVRVDLMCVHEDLFDEGQTKSVKPIVPTCKLAIPEGLSYD